MDVRPFRFGASLINSSSSQSAWRARVREVEDLGYDVLQVPDHLGMVAPFPSLVAAADVTSIRLGTYVLNGGVQSPTYLARDVADTGVLVKAVDELIAQPAGTRPWRVALHPLRELLDPYNAHLEELERTVLTSRGDTAFLPPGG